MQQRKKPVTFFMSQAFGAPEGTRTPDLLIRSQTLYPAELRAHINGAENRTRTGTIVTYRRILSPVRLPIPPPRHIILLEAATGFEPVNNGFADRCLSHLAMPPKKNGAGERI